MVNCHPSHSELLGETPLYGFSHETENSICALCMQTLLRRPILIGTYCKENRFIEEMKLYEAKYI